MMRNAESTVGIEKKNNDKVIFNKVQNGKINIKVKMENSQKII